MELNTNRWIVRWYFWSLGIVGRFMDSDPEYRVRAQGTNLCAFVRTIVLWAPLILLFNLAAWCAVALALYAPIYWFGLGNSALWIVAAAIILAAIIAVVAGVIWLVGWWAERPESVDEGPTSFGVAREWVAAKKARICPLISFTTTATTATTATASPTGRA